MRHTLLVVLIGAAASMLVACGVPFVELSDDLGGATDGDSDHARVWNAMKDTLISEYGARFVYVSEYPEQENRKLVASSRVNGDMLTKSRVKIEAFVVRDEDNRAWPMFQAWVQFESQTGSNGFRPANNGWFFGGGGQDIWTNVARDERTEARLTNSALERIDGYNDFGGRFGMDQKPWVRWDPQPATYDGAGSNDGQGDGTDEQPLPGDESSLRDRDGFNSGDPVEAR